MNTWFRFKQFTIEQSQCAMKVTEIACILGAATPVERGVRTALDIGGGSGLLSLMLAQKSDSLQIDCIELDENCFAQCCSNVEASPFKEQVRCIQGDVLEFAPRKQYDLLICNPPFFENDLQSPDTKKNLAWHSTALTMKALVGCIVKLLCETGYCSVLYPASRKHEVIETVKDAGLFIHKMISIRHSEYHAFTHVLFFIKKIRQETEEVEFSIRAEEGYTGDFIALMKPYYLNI